MKTLILSSSLSKNSRSFILCTKIMNDLQKKGIKTDLVDARKIKLVPHHTKLTSDMQELKIKIEHSDNIIIGMGVHNYSINDGLKIILDNCFVNLEGKFYGIVCAAGGEKSYLSTMHLTQICMNEWRMIQLPRIVYATQKEFHENIISNTELLDRIQLFVKEFITIGKKLIKPINS